MTNDRKLSSVPALSNLPADNSSENIDKDDEEEGQGGQEDEVSDKNNDIR